MNHRRLSAIAAALAASAVLAACGSMGGKPSTVVELVPTGAITPNPTRGTVTFTALDHGVRVSGEVRGLVPGSEHGFHIHEKGDCGNNGDACELPSLVADAGGVARFSVEDHSISLTDGTANNVVGRALIVHRDRDDFTTQPSGNSGPRIACAVITR